MYRAHIVCTVPRFCPCFMDAQVEAAHAWLAWRSVHQMAIKSSSSGATDAAIRPKSPRSSGHGRNAVTVGCAGAVPTPIDGCGSATHHRITWCQSLAGSVRGPERQSVRIITATGSATVRCAAPSGSEISSLHYPPTQRRRSGNGGLTGLFRGKYIRQGVILRPRGCGALCDPGQTCRSGGFRTLGTQPYLCNDGSIIAISVLN